MSCARLDRCGAQCAEIWCDGDEVGECTSETSQLVRVAERCALCAGGGLLLSRNVFQELSGAETAWLGVRWRCVSCETSSGSIGSGDVELRVIEPAVCPGLAAVEISGGISHVENSVMQDGSTKGEDLAFAGVGGFASAENDTSGSFDADIAVPAASSTYSGSDSEGYSSSSSSGSLSSSGSAQADTKPWNGQGEKTAPPMPYEPIPTIPSSPPSASLDGTSFTPSPVPANSPSSTSSSNGGSSSVPPGWTPSSGPSVSPAASDNSTDLATHYPVGTVVAPTDNPPDARSASAGSSDSTTAETTDKEVSTTSSPAPSPGSLPGSTDSSSSDGNLAATAAVTKSPFFYAALLLAIAGLAGVVVGYRAKQKRSHHNEMRAIRMSARQSTRTATPASNSRPAPPSPASLGGLGSHSIAIL